MGLGLSDSVAVSKKDAPYSVTLSTGGFWETEYLSSKSLGWCEARCFCGSSGDCLQAGAAFERWGSVHPSARKVG